MYAQVIDKQVNLVGVADVGLPLPKDFLANNPHVQCIKLPNDSTVTIGHYYENEAFHTPEQWAQLHPQPQPPPSAPTITNEELHALALMQLQIQLEAAEDQRQAQLLQLGVTLEMAEMLHVQGGDA